MNVAYCIEQLSANAEAIQALTAGLSAEQTRRKPSVAAWSVLEVINHLADEEREDFRPFIEAVFDGRAKTPHNPDEWIATRGYNARDLPTSINDFMQERQKSLAWLRGLDGVDWTQPVPYTKWVGFRAGDVLASWVAHDVLHQRQLVELRYDILKNVLSGYDVQYAGDW